ncbi:LysR family transcriptional regulator [Paraburkholderia hospita]|uniref:LysR family transcriptional regulator n=1 Tax=Paraburkholderia hospita TaxID=169430 RepID=A0AAN1JHL8_9BURK|nr:LysR family transcriptional regulator [Paraburkholderia hospita]AUT73503.1 LysR family transcriptional regulator [Paraburkholderia hospita]EIM98991.1 LysR family transcriptional regulator [Paraburkholderia hospita]OUL75251.1 LysR family transcriptional regulator [Paraburkholderia hospita]OUL94504.1 LysR family transcriptional regulator [Paraburkholderia hospita]SEH75329.1 DNA-binding transcriptional regulator, LysR family [Paraburkholderia hospita]
MDRIDALRLLIDVAEIGSFSAVARQRTVATSSVTLAVNQLEQEVGATLITRTTRRLVFTHEGLALLESARRIIAEWDSTLASLKQDGPLAGPIRVTATNDFGRVQLRPLLDRFQALHPGIHMSLLLSDSTVDLIDEHIDLALRNGPLADSNLHARLLVRGERVVCASPDYWRVHGKPTLPGDLANHNCLILARPGAPLAAWRFRVAGKQINVKVSGDRQASDGGVLREWAVAGLGVIIKNRWDIRMELAEGTLETALDDCIAEQVDLYAVYPAAAPHRRVTALIQFLSEELARP